MRQQRASEQSLKFEKKTSNDKIEAKNLITVECKKKVAELETHKADIVYSVFIAH